MTEAAILLLNKTQPGYYLMVEGGRIDHGAHETRAKVTFEELIAFDEAIAKAMEITNVEDTLIIVTADHSHTLNIVGYPKRDMSILGNFLELFCKEV